MWDISISSLGIPYTRLTFNHWFGMTAARGGDILLLKYKNNMKRCSLMLCAMMLLVPFKGMAHDFMVDSICYNVTSEKDMTCEVTFNSDKIVNNTYKSFYKDIVVVPEKVTYDGKEYTVTAIGENAFNHDDELLSVLLPSTIESIGMGAFRFCPKFKSLTLPANVRQVNNFAFMSLPSLEHLAVEEGNPYFDSREGCNAIIKTKSDILYVGCRTTRIPDGVKVIGNSAFISCFGMSGDMEPVEMTIPGSVEVIEFQAFTGFFSLMTLKLSEGLKKIDSKAFSGCGIKELVIPASVTEISAEAFSACDSIRTIKVKRGNKVYDSRKGCNAIIETATDKLIVGCCSTSIPEGVKEIEEFAFSKTDIKEIKFPSTLEMIGAHAFFNCKSLKDVVIPGNVRSVGFSAFTASGVERVVVENGVEEIGSGAFSSCKNLRYVSLPASFKKTDGLFGDCRMLERVELDYENENFYCNGYVLVDKKKGTIIDGWGTGKCYTSSVRSMVRTIGRRAFDRQELLSHVVLPEKLEKIEDQAFFYCEGLRIIECEPKIPPVLGKDVFKVTSGGTRGLPLQERVLVIVPKGSLEAYRNAPGWKEFKHIRENEFSY